MIKVKGYDVEFKFSQLKKRVDLIEQDGPLLSLFISNNGDYYLYYWLDCNDSYNRWLLLRVDLDSLERYIDGKLSLRDIITNPLDGLVWLTDIDADMKHNNTKLVPVGDIPNDYIPTPQSYFKFEKNKEIVNAINTDKYEILIPHSERSKFSKLVAKMGWKLSSGFIHNIAQKAAVL
ncbi:MAG: hypothetical protein K5854_06990 [Prevotella sp.]|nr:hypothetical protein [Prevotella sp.]